MCDRRGRGNNWAYGYRDGGGLGGRRGGGVGEGDRLLERVLETVREVVERCDRFGGFVVFHSVAGGTGSGTMLTL